MVYELSVPTSTSNFCPLVNCISMTRKAKPKHQLGKGIVLFLQEEMPVAKNKKSRKKIDTQKV